MLAVGFIAALTVACLGAAVDSSILPATDSAAAGLRPGGQTPLTLPEPSRPLETVFDTRPQFQLFPLHVSGPAQNRVNLVFFADGCEGSSISNSELPTHACSSDTVEERSKFVQDASRLANDLTANRTFAPVLPLLNFYAAYSPSNEVGAFSHLGF